MVAKPWHGRRRWRRHDLREVHVGLQLLAVRLTGDCLEQPNAGFLAGQLPSELHEVVAVAQFRDALGRLGWRKPAQRHGGPLQQAHVFLRRHDIRKLLGIGLRRCRCGIWQERIAQLDSRRWRGQVVDEDQLHGAQADFRLEPGIVRLAEIQGSLAKVRRRAEPGRCSFRWIGCIPINQLASFRRQRWAVKHHLPHVVERADHRHGVARLVLGREPAARAGECGPVVVSRQIGPRNPQAVLAKGARGKTEPRGQRLHLAVFEGELPGRRGISPPGFQQNGAVVQQTVRGCHRERRIQWPRLARHHRSEGGLSCSRLAAQLSHEITDTDMIPNSEAYDVTASWHLPASVVAPVPNQGLRPRVERVGTPNLADVSDLDDSSFGRPDNEVD